MDFAVEAPDVGADQRSGMWPYGVWATALLRLSFAGDIDLDALDEQVHAYAVAGCDGVYIGGTASEFHSLTEAEFQATATRFSSAARAASMRFQIGAAYPLAQGTLARLAFVADLKPDAIQVTLPDWTPIDLETTKRFLLRCADLASGIPLILYNPPHARTVLSPQALLEVADTVPSLKGLKCGGGDTAWYHAMAPVFRRLSVFIPGHHYHSGTTRGAHGSYSNMAALSPKSAVQWARMQPDEAKDLEARIDAFMQEAIHPLLARGLPGFVCDKAMASAGGWTSITPRLLWPYEGASPLEVQTIARAARRHIPEFAETVRAAT